MSSYNNDSNLIILYENLIGLDSLFFPYRAECDDWTRSVFRGLK